MITLTIIFCLQASPLDICFDSFYTSRKEMIDKRLEEITSAPVQVDGCYSLHCSLLVSQIFGTNCSCFLIFLISETFRKWSAKHGMITKASFVQASAGIGSQMWNKQRCVQQSCGVLVLCHSPVRGAMT